MASPEFIDTAFWILVGLHAGFIVGVCACMYYGVELRVARKLEY